MDDITKKKTKKKKKIYAKLKLLCHKNRDYFLNSTIKQPKLSTILYFEENVESKKNGDIIQILINSLY
jgi:ATP-dependent protease ClpP protease subunit